jgi:hypothetical protein
MARKKLKTILKRSIDKNNMDIFTDYIIKEKDSIKEIYDLEISTMLYDALKNIEISDGLYEALLSIDNKSILVLEERALKLYREGEVDAFITFIASNKYLLDQDKVKKIFDELINKSELDKSVEFLSKTGVFVENIFIEYFTNAHSDREIRELIAIFKDHGSNSDMEKILSICISHTSSPICYFSLADIYMESNEKDKLDLLLNNVFENHIPFNNKSMEKYYSFLENYKMVEKFSDITDKEDVLLAEAYYHLGYYEQALKIYTNIYYSKDKNVLNRIIDIDYAIKDYYSLINYVNLIEKHHGANKKFLLYKIESEIILDLYSEAESDITKYRSAFGDDTDILELRIKYYRSIDNQEMSYKIAVNLIENGHSTIENFKTVINYYYENEEYNKLALYIADNNLIYKFKPEYCSSLIYLNRIQDAIKYITEDESLLDSGMVIDSIFGIIINNSNLKKFDNINKSGTLLDVIISYVHGKRDFDYKRYIEKIKRTRSLACFYILAQSRGNTNFFNKSYVRDLLGNDRYQIISSILSNIAFINNNEEIQDMNDSKYFLYPITKALIDTKRYSKAATMLDSVYRKDPDAFYYYFRAYIEFQNSDFTEATKHVEEAISILDNVDFISLRINIALAKNANPETYIKSAIELGFNDIFGIIYEFANTRKLEVADEFKKYLESLNINDTGMYRLKRYCFQDYKLKIKFSALVILYGGNSEDVVNHYSILKTKDEQIAIYFLEHFKNRSYESYIILSSYYYGKRIIKKSLEYFNDAYIRNSKAIKNPLFQELFKVTPLPDAVINAMETTGEWFHLMIYYYNRKEYKKVREITEQQYTNSKILEFLIFRAWDKMSLKTFMIDLFNKTHDKILGELLIRKFYETELYENEIDILKTLLVQYPDEKSLFVHLINALIQNGDLNEALETAYKRYYTKKDQASFNKMVSISYEVKDYSSLINIFNNNTEFINSENIKYWIYSQIKLFNYIGTRVIMHDYKDIINENTRESINSKLRSSYRMNMVINYSGKIFETEYNRNKISGIEEIKNQVPEYISSDIYDFISNSEPYSYIDAIEYNEKSVNIISRLSQIGISDIRDIKIYHIYHVTGDVIKSKNFYIFIKRCMEGYYKIDKFSENWHFIKSPDAQKVPTIIEVIVKYNIGLMDAIYIAGKIKSGMLN